MKMRANITTILLLVSLLAVVISSVVGGNDKKNGGLRENFYGKSCKSLEKIVRSETEKKVDADKTLAPKLLRLHYHDCFVRKVHYMCVCVDPVNGDNTTEKNAVPNRSLAGFEVIDDIKEALEKQCPNTNVSCADILALSARDAVSVLAKKSLWKVLTGRRDGIVTRANEASRDLPSPGSNFTTLLTLFGRFGLDKTDLVALSGAHTIGVTHCPLVFRRLYNFTGKGDTDPALAPAFANELKKTCPPPVAVPATTVDMDRRSALTFDGNYFSGLIKKRGVFTSDAALLTDPASAHLVNKFSSDKKFMDAFAISMVKMGAIGVLTGDEGEIRNNCRAINN
ncbi:peroxidase 24 [Humulus lupulus]|uniref:peroxidase 24 n=1 Tax=Humulus lupulus TaxID=3486 RepID=UPI002B406086|nr:peroxidase 24 [Humulus lupulus]